MILETRHIPKSGLWASVASASVAEFDLDQAAPAAPRFYLVEAHGTSIEMRQAPSNVEIACDESIFPRLSDLEMINASLDDWIMSESDAEDIANDSDADFLPLTSNESIPLPQWNR